MRKAFSMLTAIFIIVLMATVGAFILNLSGKMVKGTTAQFHNEQAVLLAKSYTEYAIMAVTANEHTGANCLNDISGKFGDLGDGTFLYNVDVNISYIGDENLHGSCRTLNNSVDTEKSPLSIIVDVFVKHKDLDHPAGAGAPDITYHRRSLQKI